jgi:hypothetical protein
MFVMLVFAVLGIACAGDFGYPAAERAAVTWAATPVAQTYMKTQGVLTEVRDFKVTCATALPLTDADKEAGITESWCVTVGYLGRVRTFDGATAALDAHSLQITVKAEKGAAPTVRSWDDCLCGSQ